MKTIKNIYFNETGATILNALYINRIAKNNKTPYSTLVEEGLILLYEQEFKGRKDTNE